MTSRFRYDDVCALKYFINALRVYPHKKIDDSFFMPYTRCDRNERFIYDLMDEFIAEDDPRRGKDWLRPACYEILQGIWHKPDCRENVRRRLLSRATKLLRELRSGIGEPVEKVRLAKISEFTNLNANERKIFEICWLCTTGRINENLTIPYGGEKYEYFAMLAGIDEMTVREILSPGAKLRRFGIVNREKNCELTEAASIFMEGGMESLASAFYKEDVEESLPGGYFGEVAEDHLPILRSLLKGKNGKCVNIVLYGASGTGKTSFARRLARETGRRLLSVVQNKIKDGEYSPVRNHDRCTALRVCAEHADAKNDIILMDEADNLLGRWDKGSMNVILENASAPVIWVANVTASEIDPSMQRRFDYSIYFAPFDCRGRRRIWMNALEQAKMPLPENSIIMLAEKYAVNAGVITKAVANAKKVGAPRLKALERFLGQAMELSGGKVLIDRERNVNPAGDYSFDGLNIVGDIPLGDIVECVRNFCKGNCSSPDAPRLNILLSGPAGSGKTEFVKFLAQEAGRPLEVVTGSQLLDKYVGGTEKNIAAVFQRAESQNAVLFLDEIDSFLQDRKDAAHNWEVSQVNELLQQMESFGGVMIGATNFAEYLDRTVLRRFTFKLKMDYLNVDGRRTFFERFFGLKAEGEVWRRLAALDNLTPGDFRTARQSLYYIGGKRTAADYLAALERESEMKRSGESKRIGFCT